jgi:8-oxo-dGTP pyrophosphatase MutT (NUDIX family)
VVRRGDEILVFEGRDPTKEGPFYRPLGGTIEFGEYSHQALVREMREEIAAEIEALRYLGSLENIYVYDGRPGHEIVQVYEAAFADPAMYEHDAMTGHEDSGAPFPVLWKSLDFFARGEAPLYPDGLLELLIGRQPRG